MRAAHPRAAAESDVGWYELNRIYVRSVLESDVRWLCVSANVSRG